MSFLSWAAELEMEEPRGWDLFSNFPICFISHQGLGDLSYFKYNFVLGRLKAHHRNVLLV